VASHDGLELPHHNVPHEFRQGVIQGIPIYLKHAIFATLARCQNVFVGTECGEMTQIESV
jgi:hypothetical protein